MAARKPPAKKKPAAKKSAAKKSAAKDAAAQEEDEIYVIDDADEFDEEGEDLVPDVPTSIETDVTIDAIEYEEEEEPEQTSEPVYRVTMHARLPEHIAQHLFAQHVQEGRITVEFHPADTMKRRKNTLVRR